MNYKNTFLIVFLLTQINVVAQIPVNEYRKEIQNLKTEVEFKTYWDKLYKIDQEILVHINDQKEADSLSVDNMIKTALMFEIHGDKVYDQNNVVPIVSMSHNTNGNCQIAFWPILKRCANIGGVIDRFGGKFPTYQLESVGLTFYNYSFLYQESKYPESIKKMDTATDDNVVVNLLKAFENQKKLYLLKEKKVLAEWFVQHFIDLKEDEGTFAFVIMSDDEIYIKKNINIQKLELIEKRKNSKIYKINNEPFGWTYDYGNDGNLTLRDENENILIEYTKYK